MSESYGPDDISSCKHYSSHLNSLKNIYGRPIKRQNGEFLNNGIVDYSNVPLENLEKSKYLSKIHFEKEKRGQQNKANVRLLNNIQSIKNGDYKTVVPKLVEHKHKIKSLRSDFFNRSQKKLISDNNQLKNRLASVKSDMSRDNILKCTSQILGHSAHLSNFKTQKRSDIKLPSIVLERRHENLYKSDNEGITRSTPIMSAVRNQSGCKSKPKP